MHALSISTSHRNNLGSEVYTFQFQFQFPAKNEERIAG